MAKSLKAENPLTDSGGSMGVKDTPMKVLNYALFILMFLVSGSVAAWAWATGKESVGMDEESGVTMEVR